MANHLADRGYPHGTDWSLQQKDMMNLQTEPAML